MRKQLFFGTAALIGLAACGSDDPTVEDYNDVASAIAPMVVGDSGDTAAMDDTLNAATGQVPANFNASGSGTLTGQRGSLSYTYNLNCQDDVGAAQTACDTQTDRATVDVTWNGELNTVRYQATVQRTGSWTLTDVTSPTATFSGNGTFDVQSEFQSFDGNRQRTYTLAYTAAYNAVQIDTTTRRPTGGGATFTIDTRRTASNRFRDVEAEFTMTADVTFDAQGNATLVLDGDRTYNLATASDSVIVTEASF